VGRPVGVRVAHPNLHFYVVLHMEFFHGSDVDSVESIVAFGIDPIAAAALGGGDVFWMTEDLPTARIFALVNPAGGPPAVVGTQLPQKVVDSLVTRGVMRFDAPTGTWQVVDWGEFNNTARFYRVE